MSAPSPPTPPHKKHHPIVHHLRKPYGVVVVIAILFMLGWGVWTFVVW